MMLPTTTAPELHHLVADANHVDVKTARSNASLREFVAAALGWQPSWMKLLFRARKVLAHLLHLQHPDAPMVRLRPEEIPFIPGTKVGFFAVTEAAEDRYLVLEASDTHLTGYLAVVAEAKAPGRNRFYVMTIVKYHHWTGPLYFNIIRPFHHLVVRSIVNAGARGRELSHHPPLLQGTKVASVIAPLIKEKR